MLIKVLCAVVSVWLLAGAAAGEADSPAGVALVQVDAKRINAVQMHAQPYDGQDLMEIEERGNAQSRHSLRHSHSSRHSHRLPSMRVKPPRRLSRSRCHRDKERAAAPSRRSPHHLLVAVEKPPKSQSLSPCEKCSKKNRKCHEQKCRPLEKERRHQKTIKIKKPKGKSLDKQEKLTRQTREQQNQTKLLKELQHLKNKVRKLQRKLRKKQKSVGKEGKPVKEVIIREKEESEMTKKVEPVILPLMERLVSLTKQQRTPAIVETSCCSLNTQTAPKDSSPACESCEHAASTDCCATGRPSTCSSDMKNSSSKNPGSKSSPTDNPSSESSSPAIMPSQSSSSDTFSEFFSRGNSSINSPSTDSPSTNSISTNDSPDVCAIRDDSTTNSLIE
ncbi:hypothetical protein E2C01_013331 [Portunus trituberculatus]|uniref:Uncharacterized protein n=1 Tax=Portunus trituberculatus TaxID=210409 RepID=A0A5B7DGT1_PORTR|nr:hypothetical protein [Portunus trituberculatus]